jgi:hypothetical protein
MFINPLNYGKPYIPYLYKNIASQVPGGFYYTFASYFPIGI